MATSGLNDKAIKLRQLCRPGDPLVLTNVYDAATAAIVVAHPSTKAIATASFAIAEINGVRDPDLTLEDNLAGIQNIAKVVSKTNLPLTADLQDGYDNIAATVKQAIESGAVGANIEDLDGTNGQLREVNDAVSRIKTALHAASEAGVPDFCINARTDVLAFDGSISDAIERGQAYLKAGAVTVYVWGGGKGRVVTKDEVRELVDGLGGMLNVKMKLERGFLNAKELAELGVARMSVGPDMYWKAMAGFRNALETVAKGESFA